MPSPPLAAADAGASPPPAPRRARRPLGPFALGLGVLLGFTFCGYTSDDIWCNEAVAHLAECCPGLDPADYACEPPTFPVGCSQLLLRRGAGEADRPLVLPVARRPGACESPYGPPPARVAP